MKSNKQSKIKINKSGFKRSRFNWSHDVNTTFSWGEIQPTQCKLLIPGSKTTMSTQNLIRLAPMVAPTFGRVKYKTFNQFVGMSEIFPNWDAMMAQMPKSTAGGTKVPEQVPMTTLGHLSQWVLHGARATLYLAQPTISDSQTAEQNAAAGYYITAYRDGPNDDLAPGLNFKIDRDVLFGTVFNTITDPYASSISDIADVGTRVMLDLGEIEKASGAGSAFPVGSRVVLGTTSYKELTPVKHEYTVQNATDSKVPDYMKEVSLEGADYVIEGRYDQGSGVYVYFAIAFELSDAGKRLRKILQGCGYQINFTSRTQVSILPLLAQYKAYFDVFGLQLYQGWETTYAAKLIKYIESDFVNNVNCVYNNGMPTWSKTKANYFRLFLMTELLNEWYTEQADYVGAHMSKLAVSPKLDQTYNTVTPEFISVGSLGEIQHGVNINGIGDGESVDSENVALSQLEYSTTTLTTTNNNEVHGFINQVQHGQVDAEVLKRLYKWTNRNTILGREIAKILRAQGLGKYVDECKSNYIGATDTMITISDVISQAATEQAVLGEYGGRGLQYDASGVLVFENDEYGYWVTLATVVPEAGYTQGIDTTLFCDRKLTFYNPDFDAVGMEQTPKEAVAATNIIAGRFTDQEEQGFGFIPRYSKFKVCNNLTNGDFNRHSKRNTYLPYTLDKQINVNDYDVTWYAYTAPSGQIPAYAGTKIQRGGRWSNMPVAGNVWRTPTKYAWLGNFDRIFYNIGEKADADIGAYPDNWLVGFDDYNDDNFMSHSIYDVQSYAPMKPIEDSYGLDEDDPMKSGPGADYVVKA